MGAAYTHDDVLYQAYFIAYLVLDTINNGSPAPLNPGNPYIGSKTQNGFGTFGQPDIAATLVAVAGKRSGRCGTTPTPTTSDSVSRSQGWTAPPRA